jgi:hypothetical protein
VTFNHGVEGSSPSALTKKIRYLPFAICARWAFADCAFIAPITSAAIGGLSAVIDGPAIPTV